MQLKTWLLNLPQSLAFSGHAKQTGASGSTFAIFDTLSTFGTFATDSTTFATVATGSLLF